jgi:hypothetical protein
MKQENDFLLPESILTQLEEMSGGGYMMIVLGSDGLPNIYESYDSALHEAQIKNFSMEWLEADRQCRLERIKKDIMSSYDNMDDNGCDD